MVDFPTRCGQFHSIFDGLEEEEENHMNELLSSDMNGMILILVARAFSLLTALPLHAYLQAWMAGKLGDPTPRYNGRLDINFPSHLDPIGSIVFMITGMGWIKPVPINRHNLKNPKRDIPLALSVGLFSHLALALVCMILYKFGLMLLPGSSGQFTNFLFVFTQLLSSMMICNISTFLLNLIPLAPLEGWKILGPFMKEEMYWEFMGGETRSMGLLIMVFLVFTDVVTRPIEFLTNGVLSFFDLLTFFLG